MTERNQSIFLLSLFKGIDYIENRFLLDKESIIKIIYSLKPNQIEFIQKIRQMILLDSSQLNINELSEKYGIPFKVIADILKENTHFSNEEKDAKKYFSENQEMDQNENFLNGQLKYNESQIDNQNHSIGSKQIDQDIQENQKLKQESEDLNQEQKTKLIGLAKNILTVKKSDKSNGEEDQSELKVPKVMNSEMLSIYTKKKKNQEKTKQKKVQITTKAHKLSQHFEQNQNGDFICKQCQKLYTLEHLSNLKNKQVLYNHFYEKHAQKFLCDKCDKSFITQQILDKHVRKIHEQ